MNTTIVDDINERGFAIIPDVIDSNNITALIAATATANFARSTRGDDVFGARNILSVPEIQRLSRNAGITSLVESAIGASSIAVRGIFFDKTPIANWPVAWHQDLSLAVMKREDIHGWGNWSIKAGIHHVQPPYEILEQMITLRIHLDDSGMDTGPLRVLPGSHRRGRIPADESASLRSEIPEHTCLAAAGSALAMKPLILHASSAARRPAHRRVIHIEYAPKDLLPPELNWAFAL
jgi:ectoine hydroxylase-related dioxygenase (phytanoyl-CoA dioxygenase family)